MGRIGRHIKVMYEDPYPWNGLDRHPKKASAYGIQFLLRTGITPAPPSARGRRSQGGRHQGGRRRPGSSGANQSPKGQTQGSAQETEANMEVTFGDEDIDETTDNDDKPIQVTSALSTIDNCFDHDAVIIIKTMTDCMSFRLLSSYPPKKLAVPINWPYSDFVRS